MNGEIGAETGATNRTWTHRCCAGFRNRRKCAAPHKLSLSEIAGNGRFPIFCSGHSRLRHAQRARLWNVIPCLPGSRLERLVAI